MSKRYHIKLSAEELLIFTDFCRKVQLPPQVVIKQSLFFAMNEAESRAMKLLAEQEKPDATIPSEVRANEGNDRNIGSNTEAEQPSEVTASGVLAGPQENGTDTGTSE